MKVLISLLGLSPGVVTGAYYALYHGWGIDEPVQVDKVVTLGTSAPGMGRFESEIARELNRWRTETGAEVQYDDTCRLHIAAEDLRDEASVREFREKITSLLREDYRDDEVYLVVAGGRKSMAALAAVAAQLYGYGVQGMYHLYVDENLEYDGSPERFWVIDQKRRREVMYPPEGQCSLVEIPYLQFKGREGEIELVVRGEVQDYIIEYLEENPDFVPWLEQKSRGNVLGYVFEVKVMQYLQRQGYSPAWHHYRLPDFRGDVDVYAEKESQILICECRFFEEYDPARHAVDVGKVKQALDRLKFLRERYPDMAVEAWVVSNAETAWDDAWNRAGQDVRLMTTGPLSHRFRTSLLDWGISQIKPMKPPKGNLSR